MTTDQTQRCEQCGTELDPQALFCETCGYPVATRVQPQPPPASPPIVTASAPDIPSPPNNFAPKVSGKKRPSPILWVGLGCTMVVFCAMIIGGGALVFGSQGGYELPFNLPWGQSDQPGKPEATLQILRDANPTEINTPLIIPTEEAPPQAASNPITVEQVPYLVLAANEIPSGWTIERRPDFTNEDWLNIWSNPEEYSKYSKILENSGRLVAIRYKYLAPGDPCDELYVLNTFQLFEDPEGAKYFFEGIEVFYNSGEDLGIGEQSDFYYYDEFSPSCNSRYTNYDLSFLRLNTIVFIGLHSLEGAISTDEAKELLLSYARIVDYRIIANAK